MRDADAEARAVAEIRLDRLGAIAGEEEELGQPRRARGRDQPLEQRPSADRHHRLGQIGQSQPRPPAAREHDRLHASRPSAQRAAARTAPSESSRGVQPSDRMRETS